MGRRVGGTVEGGAGDGGVVERVVGMGFGNKDGSFLNKRRGRRFPIAGQPREAGAGESNTGQRGRTVLARLPRGGLAPPVAVEQNVPRVVRDDAVGVAPVDLVVEVHVGDGQGSFTKGIIAKIGVGQRCRCRIFVQHISACGDELVRRVVLVGGDQQSAAEAGAGFADGAAERIFIRTRPARRGEARRAFDRF